MANYFKKILSPLMIAALLILVSQSCSTNDPTINNSVKTAGNLDVTVTASTYNGRYAPRHVMAIWVESSSGTFVKTLVAKAAERRQYLTNWLKATSSGNTTDAITGATLNSYSAVNCSWDGTNVSGDVVGDGDYNVNVEYTENDGTGKIATFAFSKGTSTDARTPATSSGVSVGKLTWTPN